MKLEELTENIRVNDRIQDPKIDKEWDKAFPKYERIGKGSYQEQEGDFQIWLYSYKDEDGKLHDNKFKYEEDYMEFTKA